MSDEIIHADGRVELASHDEIARSALYNHDLAPVRVADRTWSTWDFAALWVSMAHCIPTYTLAATLIAAGMAWWQALGTILLGNLIVLVPILLNSHPGTKYGIPFPVFARAAYGVRGSNLPAMMRALVACGWFGINAWIGGEAVHTLMLALWPGWDTALGAFGGHTTTEWISFLAFWALNIAVVYRGMELLRKVERWAAPFVLVMTAALVWWALDAASGLGPLVERGGTLHGAAFFKVFMPALTGVIAFWSTLSLNMPDFTRFGRSQREQAIGQVVALPTTMTVFAAMGIIITSASAVIFGAAEWDPMKLARHFHSPVVVAIAMFTVIVATLAVNIAANTVSPANDFANAFPKRISFATGGLITGVIGIAMMPWKLMEDQSKYLGDWLGGYGGMLGSIAGVLVVDYWVIRKTRLVLRDLYVADGAYTYDRGWHWPAVIATVTGCVVAISGRFVDAIAFLYPYSWFLGFGVAAGLYYALARRPDVRPGA
ncbi:MAG: NCS1 family nucleobase:cation symporter-1 [Deltaproteobacteria bacterium]|nr:NCS1 family nucleobase:cation symporter-1 [Deltaproteobacteria bacterium]